MTWYDYSVAIGSFVSDLASKMQAEGWTRAEAGYDTMKPSGYSDVYVLFESLFGTLPDNDGGSSSSNFTYIQVRIRAGYDSGSHMPDTGENGGCSRFRMIDNGTDYSADSSKVYRVKGWIDGKTVLIWIEADEAISGYKRQIIFVGEVEAVGAGAATVMLLCSEYVSEKGTSSSLNHSYADDMWETHFIHCLGDDVGYMPFVGGHGASSVDNKVRPQPIAVWRRTAAGDKFHDVMYRIPANVARATAQAGAEAEDDTFTDGGQTFSSVDTPSYGDAGGVYLCKKYYSQVSDKSYHRGRWWIRKT
jgi:hypothetical protein